MSTQFNRRDFGHISLGSLIGLLLTGCQQKPFQGGVCQGSIAKMSEGIATKLVRKLLLSDPRFETFYRFFSNKDVRFIPERSQVVMYVRPPARETDSLSSPVLLAILPGLASFKRDDPSYETVSIVGLQYGDRVGGVYATHVKIGRKPFQFLSFSALEIDSQEQRIVWQRLDRETIKKEPIGELANKFRRISTSQPSLNAEASAQEVSTIPILAEKDDVNLVAEAYQVLLSDAYSQPSYFTESLPTFLRDTQLLQKWSQVQRGRYGGFEVAAAGSSSSCSSSCGCSSSSTSCSDIQALDEVINPADIISNPVELIDLGKQMSPPILR